MKTLAIVAGIFFVIYLIYRYLTRDELYYNPDEDESLKKLSDNERKRYEQVALTFANALVKGNYNVAFDMLEEHSRKLWNANYLKSQYIKMIAYGSGPVTDVEVVETMDD